MLLRAAQVNLYGPTEASVFALFSNCSNTNCVTIGKPICNSLVYILDKSMNVVSIGVVGELYLGGIGIARGYINKPDLTASAFIPNPFGKGRLYKTGDMARWLDNGEVEFIARTDLQVKIRGFRIELGGIEAAITEYSEVRQAAVVLQLDTRGEKRLVGYISPELQDISSLSAHLATKLPSYMIPATIVSMPNLPTTAGGKIDRKLLASLPTNLETDSGTIEAPTNDLEKLVIEIWSEVLGITVDKVGVNINFFELGGNSLSATQVNSRLVTKLNVKVPLRMLFQFPTVQQFSQHFQREYPNVLYQPTHGIDSLLATPDPGTTLTALSFAQERLWAICEMQPISSYHCFELYYCYNADTTRLQSCIQQIVKRHAVLRATFEVVDGTPKSRINDTMEAPIAMYSFAGADISIAQENHEVSISISNETVLSEVKSILTTAATQPFDLGRDCMLRCTIVSLAEHCFMFLCIHHIATDGWSMEIIEREFRDLYEGGQLLPLEVQYTAYAAWQRNWLQGETLETQAKYWQESLSGELPLLQLPSDKPRPSSPINRSGAVIVFDIPTEVVQGIAKMVTDARVSLFSCLLGCFFVLLHKFSGQDDIIVGTPIANRNAQRLEQIVGFFVNLLPIRSDLSDNPTFMQLIERVNQTMLDAQEHQDMPFEELIKRVHTNRDANITPIFQALFTLQQSVSRAAPKSWSKVRNSNDFFPPASTTKYDLSLGLESNLNEPNPTLRGCIEYDTDLFSRTTMERLCSGFTSILGALQSNPGKRVSSEMLLAEEYKLIETPQTTAYFPAQCVHHLVEAQAKENPSVTALVYDYGKQSMTYYTLMRTAEMLSQHIIDTIQVTPDTVIGICAEQSSWEMVVGLLAVWKSGAAYVPLDPTLPAERLAYMTTDSQASVLLYQPHLLHMLPEMNVTRIPIDSSTLNSRVTTRVPQASASDINNLAYIIYTSGSTGLPKGIAVEHKSLVNFAWSFAQMVKLDGQAKILQTFPLSFDGYLLDVVPALISGSVLYLKPEEILAGEELLEYARKHQITSFTMTPSKLSTIADGVIPSMKFVGAGGERLAPELAHKLSSRYG